MKFVLASEHLYWWPVTVEMPHPDKAGQWVKQSFTMQFAAIDEDDARKKAREIAKMPEEDRGDHQHDMLISACRNWRDVADENGSDITFSPETLRLALNQPWFRAAVYNAYARSLASDGARKGN